MPSGGSTVVDSCMGVATKYDRRFCGNSNDSPDNLGNLSPCDGRKKDGEGELRGELYRIQESRRSNKVDERKNRKKKRNRYRETKERRAGGMKLNESH